MCRIKFRTFCVVSNLDFEKNSKIVDLNFFRTKNVPFLKDKGKKFRNV